VIGCPRLGRAVCVIRAGAKVRLRGYHTGYHTPYFLSESAQSHEKKRVVILASAKKCEKLQKSAQGYESLRIPPFRSITGLSWLEVQRRFAAFQINGHRNVVMYR
jgi:hypothetical protein